MTFFVGPLLRRRAKVGQQGKELERQVVLKIMVKEKDIENPGEERLWGIPDSPPPKTEAQATVSKGPSAANSKRQPAVADWSTAGQK